MCGRYTLTTSARDIADLLAIMHAPEARPRYNISPSQHILVARHDELNQVEIVNLKWGLIPSFIKDPKLVINPINARSETVVTKPFFRDAIRHRRCLIPANGYYEWQHLDKIKQPYLMRLHDNSLFFLAGIWESWISDQGEVIETVAMLTTEANQLISKVHDRMPVIVRREHHDLWLTRTNDNIFVLSSLMEPYPSSEMAIYPVSTIVNSAKNETPECIEPSGKIMKLNSAE